MAYALRSLRRLALPGFLTLSCATTSRMLPYILYGWLLLTDRIPKETCQERTVCRMMRTNGYWMRSHERILDEVSRCRERIRSHYVRCLSGSISVEIPYNLL